jgi:hypothetical protein
VNAATPSFVTFDEPAPKKAHLQFTGIGFDLEVSFDNGLSWKSVATKHNREIHSWRYRNYWMAIPPGRTGSTSAATTPGTAAGKCRTSRS